MMDEVEASTKTANEKTKEADITTETGEYENSSKVGVEKVAHRSQHRHMSRDKMRQLTSECPTQCLPACRWKEVSR